MSKSVDSKHLSEFGKALKAMRQTKELSQEALALKCDLDRTYIGGVERGERNISLLNIIKISKALECSPRDLFKGDNYE